MHDVELWPKPINNGKNTLPVVKVADKIFIYNQDGLQCYPSEGASRPSNWRKLGETALDIARVCAKAFEIYGEKFVTFCARTANPVQFAQTFISSIVDGVQNHPIWDELRNQDWSNAKIDVDVVMNVNSRCSNRSSFNSRSNFSTS
ncbi:uncharacterized protein LOC134830484 [Culicoides brevitarsis]|uniref:uncharacterized protein LOC134830484 n=1 Tax=Culicoides brevitarsis TaxID=469753 RepID=UPI00307B5906